MAQKRGISAAHTCTIYLGTIGIPPPVWYVCIGQGLCVFHLKKFTWIFLFLWWTVAWYFHFTDFSHVIKALLVYIRWSSRFRTSEFSFHFIWWTMKFCENAFKKHNHLMIKRLKVLKHYTNSSSSSYSSYTSIYMIYFPYFKIIMQCIRPCLFQLEGQSVSKCSQGPTLPWQPSCPLCLPAGPGGWENPWDSSPVPGAS